MSLLGFFFSYTSLLIANLLGQQEPFPIALLPDITVALMFGGMACLLTSMAFRHQTFLSDSKPYGLLITFLGACSLIPVLDIVSLRIPIAGVQGGVKILTAVIGIWTAREYLATVPQGFSPSYPSSLIDEKQVLKQELDLTHQPVSGPDKSLELFNYAFEYALVGQAILSPDGEWIRINPAFCKILGYSEEELLHTTLGSLTHSEDLELEQQYFEQLLSGEIAVCQFEKRYFHKQGHFVWVLLSISLVRAPNHQPLYFIAQIDNISERKQIEADLKSVIKQLKLSIAEHSTELDKAYANLQRSAAQYQDLYDNAPDMYLSVDPETSKVLRCNQTLIKELGYSYPEIVGRSVIDLYHPDFRSEAKKAFQTFIDTGEIRNIYLVAQRKNGTTLDVSVNAQGFRDKQGKLQYSRSSWRDISERKRLENQLKQVNADLDEKVQNRTWALQVAVQSLKESQSRLELALEVSGDGWWDWNLFTDEVNWSDQFFQMLEYKSEELSPSLQTWQSLIHPDDLPRVMALRAEHLQDDAIPYVFDYRVRTKSGQWKWISAFGKVVDWNSQGEPLRMVGMHHDISDRKQAEQELQRINAELVRSNQELGHFAYVASHDLQEPLRKIGSFADLLADLYQGQLDEKADRYIRYITDGAVRMQGLIDDLLSFSRVGRAELKIEPTALSSLVDQVLTDLDKVIEQRHVEIVIDPLPTVVVDPVQMRQVFQNLISNAIKYCQADIPSIYINATQNQGLWTISVKDNGIGIDPQFNERIFIIFQRLHHREEYSGTGIGLAICKKIVERHGGRIWVDSEEGQGALFSFTLPR
ncbi:PAS domain S-box protein [Acaryochloris sp. CCMEE 5410]|uniref:PAS domain-containing sensor histidine kinase n=1 Tax=Acaryochloris sp. CCMEE 5410 TaxID=310037 RepID=UPI00024845FF|nr:PAS domain S-box protein [Acaryochloris sp. CCMEE 5410]KAI9132234.1 PAS domain S-box protein [Acaryochloris sp. CCMEE 5410]